MKLLAGRLITIMLIALANCGTRQTPPDPMALVNSERAFAAAAAQMGVRDAFLEYSADEAVMFVPGAVRVKEHYGASPKRSALLTWQPTYAELSSSGDLGWTTGPWEWRAQTAADTPIVSGHYITIWRLQPDSTWKFVLDIGIAHDPHQSAPPAPVLSVVDRPKQAESERPGIAKERLVQAEYILSSASAGQGMVAACLTHATEDIRYYRMGEFPLQSAATVSAALGRYDGTWTWEVLDADVSRSTDLGYTYGVSTLVGPEATVRFSYMHIWRRSAEGPWKLALDIHIPIPTEQETKP